MVSIPVHNSLPRDSFLSNSIRNKSKRCLIFIFFILSRQETYEEAQEPPKQPPLLAKNITSWLAERGISQTFFAKNYMERSQGTVSDYLNNPPQEVPRGLGKAPWIMMGRFIKCDDVRDDFLEKARG